MRELIIDGTRIADDTECFVIAELGHNHQGSIDTCKKMIDAAAWAGCDAVKLQKRDNKTLYTEEYYNSPYNSENAFGPTYGLHREALEFDFDDYLLLQGYADRLGIGFFATAFDVPSADFLRRLEVPAFKIASGDLTNTTLLTHVMGFGKPIIISTGGATESQVIAAHSLLVDHPHAILHCTSGYPASYDELNLMVIQDWVSGYEDAVIGWSAHDTGIAMAPVAYAYGARIIEKHFTLDRSMKGTDQAMSLEPSAMKQMIHNLELCKRALGDGTKRVYESERTCLAKQWKNAQGRISGAERFGASPMGPRDCPSSLSL